MASPLRYPSCLGLLVLGLAPPGQDHAASPRPQADATAPKLRQDLEELAQALASAHGIAADAKPIESFRAAIMVEPRQKDAVSTDVRVDFQAPREMRCEVIEKGVRAERGLDRRGPWAISGDEVVKLGGPEHNQEVEQITRDLRMCQQMVRFVDPRRLLGSLREPTHPRQEDLEITARLRFAGCTLVEGTLDSFPTYALGTEGRARVLLYVHPDSKQLLAIRATPLAEDGKPHDLAELVLLQDYAETRGVQLPTKLNVYRLSGPGRELLTTVHIRAIELGKEFEPDHFARPRK